MPKAAKNRSFSLTLTARAATVAQIITLLDSIGDVQAVLRAVCAFFGYTLGPRL